MRLANAPEAASNRLHRGSDEPPGTLSEPAAAWGCYG
jgi:hypothetical protein